MLELDYIQFMEVVKHNEAIQNTQRRVLHYIEKDTGITLMIKSSDYWEYYTVIPISKIIEFGNSYDVTPEEAVNDFKVSMLKDAIRVTEEDSVEVIEQLSKSVEITPGEDMEEEADTYDKFLTIKFNKWEKAVMGFLDETLKDDIQKDYVNKSFGDFLSRLFNAVNTSGFFTQLKAVLSKDYLKGVGAAEEELDLDIGVGINFDQNMKSVTERQLDGFMIDGKPWGGIKGVAEDTQDKIRKAVQESITNKTGMKELKSEISGIFNQLEGTEITDGRATKIARTESSRLIGAAKVNSYKKSGLKGKKVWSTYFDDRTSDLCKRLNGQEVDLYEDFVDPKTGNRYDHNPSHVNCRCVVNFVNM